MEFAKELNHVIETLEKLMNKINQQQKQLKKKDAETQTDKFENPEINQRLETSSATSVAILLPENSDNYQPDMNKCIFCRIVTFISSTNCMITSLQTKWGLVESTGICFRCLRGKHNPSECLSKTKCKRCCGMRETILCKFDPVHTINNL